MLVLSRKEGESIIVAGNITLTVMSVGQGRVKIGIKAPSEVTIDRAEIHDKKIQDDLTVLVGDLVVEADAVSGPASMPPAEIVNRISKIQARPAKPSDFRKKAR